MSNKTVAVILAGSGVYDGSEINEVVLSLLSLEEAGIAFQCFAPDISQHHVINHLSGEDMNESRNVLVEAARIVRGNVKALTECRAENFDGLLVPGGYGVAKNLSNFAFEGANLTINQEVLSLCLDFKEAGKAAGYMCIAPALLPKIYGDITYTIGNDKETASAVGSNHVNANVDEIVVDERNKVVTTPAYMLAESIAAAKSGIDKLVKKLAELL